MQGVMVGYGRIHLLLTIMGSRCGMLLSARGRTTCGPANPHHFPWLSLPQALELLGCGTLICQAPWDVLGP